MFDQKLWSRKAGKAVEITNWKELLYPYEQAVEELLVKFQNIIKEYKRAGVYCPMDSVSGRVKRASSILEKAGKKQISPDRIEKDIEDIAGIRILCQFVEDIEKVIGLIRSRDGKDMTILEERDYITNTKPSGYRSYHIIIRYPLITAFGSREILAEIQIRTLAMNFWATIEHSLRYKYSENIPKALQQRLTNCAEASFHLDKEMATIREEIMNVQRLNEIKNNLVDTILENIHSLYFKANLDEIESINREFILLWNEGDLDKLRELNEKLNVLTELYRI